MHIRIVEYADQWAEALAAFNARLATGGSSVAFPPPPDPAHRPPRFHDGLKQVRYLAIEERCEAGLDRAACVRGAYALKFQQFWLAGAGSRRGGLRDFRLRRNRRSVVHADCRPAPARRRPETARSTDWGWADSDKAAARFLKAAGWQMFAVPFFLPCRPFVQLPAEYRHLGKGRTPNGARPAGLLGLGLDRGEWLENVPWRGTQAPSGHASGNRCRFRALE